MAHTRSVAHFVNNFVIKKQKNVDNFNVRKIAHQAKYAEEKELQMFVFLSTVIFYLVANHVATNSSSRYQLEH